MNFSLFLTFIMYFLCKCQVVIAIYTTTTQQGIG
nr:MAG TPA: SCIMP protein [Caudoviricetes sp.]DAV07197.1 MAG TPA: SCIMP protein [Caudoviricetes sp.]